METPVHALDGGRLRLRNRAPIAVSISRRGLRDAAFAEKPTIKPLAHREFKLSPMRIAPHCRVNALSPGGLKRRQGRSKQVCPVHHLFLLRSPDGRLLFGVANAGLERPFLSPACLRRRVDRRRRRNWPDRIEAMRSPLRSPRVQRRGRLESRSRQLRARRHRASRCGSRRGSPC